MALPLSQPKPVQASSWLCSTCGNLHIAAFLAVPVRCCGFITIRNGPCFVHSPFALPEDPNAQQQCDGCHRGVPAHELEPCPGEVDRWLCADCTRSP